MKRAGVAAWLLCLAPLANADAVSHQIPPPVETGQMTTAQGRLDAAMVYVGWFMAEDAQMNDPVAVRGPMAPTWPSQPLRDCRTRAVINGYKVGKAYFESGRQNVAAVPVAVDLVIIDAANEGGPNEKPLYQGGVGCTFEYERYSPVSKRFAKVGGFRKRMLYEEFLDWGPFIVLKDGQRYMIAPRQDEGIVRFLVRVSVDKGAPYQLEPQFPRHFSADSVAPLLKKIVGDLREGIRSNTSDRDPAARGAELKKDMARMRRLARNNGWTLDRIEEHLEYSRQHPALQGVEP